MLIRVQQAGSEGNLSSSPPFLDDPLLVARCLEGDDNAWESMVRQYIARILHLGYRYTCNREEAEDLMQEVFMRVYLNLHSYRTESGSFHTWVYAVARNLIIDHYRQTKRLQNTLGSEEMNGLNLEEDRVPDPHQAAEQAETLALVRGGLQGLSPQLEQAVFLRDIEGMSYQDIARRLRLPEGTIKSRVKRGRMQLARILFRRGVRRGTTTPSMNFAIGGLTT